ncbi:unnamed protein product [Symbiodinium sp. CCMP2592]|nr:unnamed protein product [Symbiodinium sp. CCMP2592]
MCGQFVWPCPREFPADPAVRKARNFTIPEDMSKETLGQTFKAVLAKHNQFVNLDSLHILVEPHKKFNAATGLRARHYHIIFRFKAVFAHLQIAKSLHEKDAWLLAKKRKLAVDDLLFNTLGAWSDVTSLVAKVILTRNCEGMPTGTLMFHANFALQQFLSLDAIDLELPRWVSEGHLSRALVLQGDGGLGKMELACAIMAIICKDKGFHFVNKLDRLRDATFLPHQGLVVDELCLHNRDIDDVKGLLDLAKHRDVQCRNKDGRIPVRCPRIFSANWGWDGFFPPAVAQTKHEVPIMRRVVWVEIAKDICPLPLLTSFPGGSFPARRPAELNGILTHTNSPRRALKLQWQFGAHFQERIRSRSACDNACFVPWEPPKNGI